MYVKLSIRITNVHICKQSLIEPTLSSFMRTQVIQVILFENGPFI